MAYDFRESIIKKESEEYKNNMNGIKSKELSNVKK